MTVEELEKKITFSERQLAGPRFELIATLTHAVSAICSSYDSTRDPEYYKEVERELRYQMLREFFDDQRSAMAKALYELSMECHPMHQSRAFHEKMNNVMKLAKYQ